MTRPAQGLPGGAQAAITTTPVAVDLSALRGRSVSIGCDDDDIWFAFGDGTSTTLVTAGASAASLTSLKAKRLAKGCRAAYLIGNSYPYLIVRGVTTTGTVHVDVVSESDGAVSAPITSSAPALGTVVTSDGGGSLTVDSAQLPTTLGQKTAAASLSVIEAIDTTDDTTYIASGDMSASVNGASKTLAAGKEIRFDISWGATGTPLGTFMLQTLGVDGSTWFDIPESVSQFAVTPTSVAGAAGQCMAHFRSMRVHAAVRLQYLRTSGGTANTSLTVRTRLV